MKYTSYVLAFVVTAFLLSCTGKTNVETAEASNVDTLKFNDITGKFLLPPLSHPGEGAYVSGELIYPLDDKPTPECHASTIVETPSGFVSAFFAGTKERDPDV